MKGFSPENVIITLSPEFVSITSLSDNDVLDGRYNGKTFSSILAVSLVVDLLVSWFSVSSLFSVVLSWSFSVFKLLSELEPLSSLFELVSSLIFSSVSVSKFLVISSNSNVLASKVAFLSRLVTLNST